MHSSRASFTLIELLIVIAIVAVLSVVVLVTLNPVELLNQSRDSARISDLDTLNRSLALFTYSLPSGSLGDSTKIYVSVPDPTLVTATGTCTAAMGFSAPSGYTYVCASSSTFTKTNGTGWIPVDFTQMTGVSAPINRLPTDPINTTSSGFYYTYVSGSWAFTATLQSQKYLQQSALRDGGVDSGRLEVGTDIALIPKSQGLIGYWKFDETAGATSAVDSSGNGNVGTPSGGISFTTGKVGGALNFNTNGVITVAATSSLNNISSTAPYTLQAWINPTNFNNTKAGIIDKGTVGTNGFGLHFTDVSPYNKLYSGQHGNFTLSSPTVLSTGAWYHVAAVYDPNKASPSSIYINGALDSNGVNPGASPASGGTLVIGGVNNGAGAFNGMIDEVKIYNRALSAAEILADYNATK